MVQNGSARLTERRREILEAAARLFRVRGFHRTGMRDIAVALGMTVGNLYYYFESKEALLAFCQDQATRMLTALAEWVETDSATPHAPGAPSDPDAKLFVLLVAHVVCLNEGVPASLAHMQVEDLSDRWREPIVERRRAYESAYQRMIESGIASGRFRDVDAKLASYGLLGAVNWTVKWFRPDGGRRAREIGLEMAATLVRGLLAPGLELDPALVAGEFELPDLEALAPAFEDVATDATPEAAADTKSESGAD